MKITNSNFYFLTFTALAALLVIGLYFFSRKHDCCGDCHVHGADAATEQVVEAPDANAPETANELTIEPATQAAPEAFAPENNTEVQK